MTLCRDQRGCGYGSAAMSSRADIHLAQYNIAVLRHPMEHADNRSFEDLLDETNRLAEASPGFVWRHGIDSREVDDTAYDDPHVLVNASVWESFEQLRDYAFRGWHRDVFKRRAEWFVSSAATMWWVPAGHVPSLHECVARLAFQHHHGPSPYAFGMNEKHRELVVRSTDPDDLTTSLTAELDGSPAATVALTIDASGEGHVDGLAACPDDAARWLADAAAVAAIGRGAVGLSLDGAPAGPIGRPYHWPPHPLLSHEVGS